MEQRTKKDLEASAQIGAKKRAQADKSVHGTLESSRRGAESQGSKEKEPGRSGAAGTSLERYYKFYIQNNKNTDAP